MSSSRLDWMSMRELERVLLVDEVCAFASAMRKLMMMKEFAISCSLRNADFVLVLVLSVPLLAVQDREL